MQAMRFNVAAVFGLLLIFAGAWRVFGWGAALLAVGWLIWFTALFVLHVAKGPR
jgi:hypothetical protein